MNMQSTSRKGVLYALGFVTLAATSAAVFAESAEFRRGYQEGFQDARDGDRAQYGQYNQVNNNGNNNRIVVDRARYGVQGKTCDASTVLQKAANRVRANNTINNKNNNRARTFSVVASNQLCGDPAPNQVKKLDVRYHCGNDEDQTRVRANEGSTLRMDC